jgi:hypothetical protein
VNFEVNNVTYYLAFNGDEGEWMLLKPAMDGFDRLDVYDDDLQVDRVIVSQSSPTDHQPVN